MNWVTNEKKRWAFFVGFRCRIAVFSAMALQFLRNDALTTALAQSVPSIAATKAAGWWCCAEPRCVRPFSLSCCVPYDTDIHIPCQALSTTKPQPPVPEGSAITHPKVEARLQNPPTTQNKHTFHCQRPFYHCHCNIVFTSTFA